MFQYYFKLSRRKRLKGPLVLVRVLMGGEWLASEAREEFRRWQHKVLVSVMGGVTSYAEYFFHIWHKPAVFSASVQFCRRMWASVRRRMQDISAEVEKAMVVLWLHQSFNILTVHSAIPVPRTMSLCNTLSCHFLGAFVHNVMSIWMESGICIQVYGCHNNRVS